MEKKQRGITPEQHAEARRAFQANEPMLAISKRLGVHRTTLNRAREKDAENGDPWLVTPIVSVRNPVTQAEVAKKAQANVIDMATRKVVQQAKEDGTLDQIVGSVEDGLRRHVELENLSLDLAVDTLNRALGRRDKNGIEYPKLRPSPVSSEASERKEVLSVAKMAIELSRDIHGKRSGYPSIGEVDDGQEMTIEERVIEPLKVPVDENDRAIAAS